jgi:HEAT repeat protein
MAENAELARILQASKEGDQAFLIRALRSDQQARRFAAHQLARLHAHDAWPELARLLNASDPGTRASGCKALGNVGATEAFPLLVDVINDDPDLGPRIWAMDALGKIGGDRALEVLAPFLNDDDWRIRRTAVHALGLLGDERAEPLLRERRKTEPWRNKDRYRRALRNSRRTRRRGNG